MSKWVYVFGVATNKAGSECADTFDLVEDWGYEESELEGMEPQDLEKVLNNELEDYVWNNIESWVGKVED